MGKVIQERIVPLLAAVAKQIPMSMASIVSPTLLARYELPRSINCAQLRLCDRLVARVNKM